MQTKTTFIILSTLHALNDGLQASLLVLLPFIAIHLKISLTSVGFLGTALGLVGIVAAVPAGNFAMKVGSLKILVFLLLFYSLGFVGVAVAPNLLTLWPFFVAAGIGFGVFHPIGFAAVSKLFDQSEYGRHISNFTALGDIGRVLLPVGISFFVATLGLSATALGYAALTFAMFVFFYAVHVPKLAPSHAPPNPVDIVTTRHLLKNRRFVLSAISGALDSFASTSLFVFLPFLLLHKHISPILLGPFTAAFFVGNLFGKAVLGRLSDRVGNAKIFMVAEALMAIFIGALVIVNSPVLIILCSIVLGALTKGTVPVGISMLAETLREYTHHEKGYSINSVIVTSVAAISPPLLGVASDRFGISAAFGISAFVALLAIVPAAMYSRTKK